MSDYILTTIEHVVRWYGASYNGQIAVDDTAHIIVAAKLINSQASKSGALMTTSGTAGRCCSRR